MAHACTHRVFLRKGSKGTRIARVIDSPCLPEVPARFLVSDKGLEDIKDE